MRKFLFLAALAVATPAFAHDTISSSRMKQLGDMAPTVCRVVSKIGGDNASDNVISMFPVYTVEEKIFVLTMCKMYLHGKLDTLKGN